MLLDLAMTTTASGTEFDWLTITVLAVMTGIAVVVIAVVVWIVVGARRVGRAVAEIEQSRTVLATARTRRDAATGTEVAAAEDAVQSARRASNAATREGEALRRRFPSSLFAGRIPEPEYEESGGGTAEPPRIAF